MDRLDGEKKEKEKEKNKKFWEGVEWIKMETRVYSLFNESFHVQWGVEW